MKFFNFGNSETWHFFQWLCNSKIVDVESLVRQSMDNVEDNVMYKLGTDVSSNAKDELMELLDDLIYELAGECPFDWDINAGTIHDDGSYESYNELFGPLLAESWNRIDRHAVAHALLIRAGKWNPDTNIPEIE